jgi:WD40 repeat protein
MTTDPEGPERSRPAWWLAVPIALAAVVIGVAVGRLPRVPTLPARARLVAPSGRQTPLAFSPDGATLATGHAGGITLWDVATGRARSTLGSTGAGVAAFSPDGRWLAAARSGRAGSSIVVTVRDVATGHERARLDLGKPALGSQILASLRFSPDGATLGVLLWDLRSVPKKRPYSYRAWNTADWTERESRELPLPWMNGHCRFSTDGRLLAAGRNDAPAVTLWDAGTGRQLATLGGGDEDSTAGIWSFDFSPDDATLAVGRNDGTIELWDLGTRRRRATLREHSPDYYPQMIAFRPGPGTPISAGLAWARPTSSVASLTRHALAWAMGRQRAPEVILWDVASGRPRVVLRGQSFPVVSPDGKLMATEGRDGTVTLWDLPPE